MANNKKNNSQKTKKNKIDKKTLEKKLKKKTKSKKSTIKPNPLLNDKEYKEAEKLFKNKEFIEAYNKYLIVLENFKDKRVYKRLIECLTKNYTYKEKTKEFNIKLNDYITTYKLLVNNRELSIFEKKLEEYKSVKPVRSKSKFILISLLGFLGIHKFLEKKYILGVIYLFTLGLFGIGVIIDLINDYAEYEDTFQLDVIRYLISLLLIVIAILNINNPNYYYLIIAAILFMPLIFSKLLCLIPKIIKIIVFILLIYFGLKSTPIIETVPINLLGTWKTSNENTNFVSIKIKPEKSTIKFNDRDQEIGENEYDSETKILKVYINATTYYKFKMYNNNKDLCIYNESGKCNVAFQKSKK